MVWLRCGHNYLWTNVVAQRESNSHYTFGFDQRIWIGRSVRVSSNEFWIHKIVERCSQGVRVRGGGVQCVRHVVGIRMRGYVCIYSIHEVWKGGCQNGKSQITLICWMIYTFNLGMSTGIRHHQVWDSRFLHDTFGRFSATLMFWHGPTIVLTEK